MDTAQPQSIPTYAEQSRRTCPERSRGKRKRGGQKGNQNARKHGFFSRDLSPEQISEFWHIIAREGVAPEIALLRIKLYSSIRQDPANKRVIEEATRLLTKWYSEKHRLGKSDKNQLRKVVRDILEKVQLALLAPSEVEGSSSNELALLAPSEVEGDSSNELALLAPSEVEGNSSNDLALLARRSFNEGGSVDEGNNAEGLARRSFSEGGKKTINFLQNESGVL